MNQFLRNYLEYGNTFPAARVCPSRRASNPSYMHRRGNTVRHNSQLGMNIQYGYTMSAVCYACKCILYTRSAGLDLALIRELSPENGGKRR